MRDRYGAVVADGSLDAWASHILRDTVRGNGRVLYAGCDMFTKLAGLFVAGGLLLQNQQCSLPQIKSESRRFRQRRFMQDISGRGRNPRFRVNINS